MLLQKEMVKCVKEINEKELSKKENQIKERSNCSLTTKTIFFPPEKKIQAFCESIFLHLCMAKGESGCGNCTGTAAVSYGRSDHDLVYGYLQGSDGASEQAV